MARNTAASPSWWSLHGPKPKPEPPSWTALGMEPCISWPGCYRLDEGDYSLHARPTALEGEPDAGWLVFVEGAGDYADAHVANPDAARDFCRRLLALPPTNKENE